MEKILWSGSRGSRPDGELLGEQDAEVKKQLDRGGRLEKNIAHGVGGNRPENHFAFGKRFLGCGSSEENVPLPVPLARPQGADVRLAKILVVPGKLNAA